MMRSMRNKVVQALQTAAREAQESAQKIVGDVAEDVLRRGTRRNNPPVSNKRKPHLPPHSRVQD